MKRKPHPKITEELLQFSHSNSYLTDENPFSKQDRPLLLDKLTAALTSVLITPE